MTLIYSILIVLGITWTVSATGLCFQLTWNINTNGSGSVNCTDLPSNRPCFEPVVFTTDSNPPNVTDIWEHLDKKKYTCPMRGSSCIKYSVTSNNAVQHMSYFCGKMIQNNNTAITSDCFTSTAGVETIEACVCETRGDSKAFPCNSSRSLHISIKFFIILTSIAIIVGNIFLCDTLLNKQ